MAAYFFLHLDPFRFFLYHFPMIHNIARGYSKLLISAAKVLLLLSFCALLGAAIVYPLWKFATTSPAVYTYTVLVIAMGILAFLLVKKIKTAGAKTVLMHFAQFSVIIGGIIAAIALVLHGKRLFAIPVCALAIIVYGVLSFGREKK